MPTGDATIRTAQLRRRITCPHCWSIFHPEEILWISSHPELIGDPRLSDDAHKRFLPTRFSVAGEAIDVRGQLCRRLACPQCHLEIPRAYLELEPFFVSILGAPSSGKSYFLASTTWQLRRTMRESLGIDFSDADPSSNAILNGYEERLFLNPQPDELVELEKTEQEGALYQSVKLGEHETIWYPRPFTFTVRPLSTRPHIGGARGVPRAMCLYDNAGEHFMPGGESTLHRATQHLAHSRAMLFLFDPTQHPQFRQRCLGKTKDPQIEEELYSHRQDLVLLEAASRVRSQIRLSSDQHHDCPLIVVVTKFDAWRCLTNIDRLSSKTVVRRVSKSLSALYIDAVRRTSDVVRQLMVRYSPEVVAAAEGFCKEVIYIPVSALGTGPKKHSDPDELRLKVRPSDIKPMWAEVPMLYAMCRAAPGLVPWARKKPKGDEEPHTHPISKFRETGS